MLAATTKKSANTIQGDECSIEFVPLLIDNYLDKHCI
jgi:hypothetical protein